MMGCSGDGVAGTMRANATKRTGIRFENSRLRCSLAGRPLVVASSAG